MTQQQVRGATLLQVSYNLVTKNLKIVEQQQININE